MARQPRNVLPDAGVFHVTMRGVDGCAIYVDDDDRFRFMSFVRLGTQRAEWRILAYCLMRNHFHLIVESGREAMSRAMHTIGFRHAQKFNERHERRGHLYGDRFKAKVIEGDDYLEAACAYVVENAARVGVHDWPWRGGEFSGLDDELGVLVS